MIRLPEESRNFMRPGVDDVLRDTKPTEGRRLPTKFDLAHAVAFFFHDQLTQLVVDLEAVGALSVRLDLKKGEAQEIADLEGEDLWAWLRNTGRQDVIDDLTYRQLTAAVVSDASHFLCESLIASGKGKTQVAYALLRKPLKENLLLLEWLAAAPEDFLSRFHGESIWPYTLNRLPENERRGIIEKAAALVDLPELGEDFQWTLRYAKEYPNSLETLWTKATHLVTNVAASATEPGNLNFVFSTADAIDEQWEHYYRVVPLVLHYFVKIAEEVASRFVMWDQDLRPTQRMMRELAVMRFADVYARSAKTDERSERLFEELSKIGFECGCGGEITVGASGIDRFWLSGEVVCPSCGHQYSVWELLKEGNAGADAQSERPRAS